MVGLFDKMMARLGVSRSRSLEGCVATFGRTVVCQPLIVCPL
jgi:hypothetical protein